MNKQESMTFTALLEMLHDTDSPLPAAAIYRMSNLSDEDREELSEAWPQLGAERRRMLLRRLTETSETNFEVDFSEIAKLGLDDPDDEVRRRAIACLWEVKQPWLLRRLRRMLDEDPASSTRAEAAAALGRYVLLGELDKLPREMTAPVVDQLLDVCQIDDESIDIRRRALESVAYSSREVVCDLIEQAYNDESYALRVSAVFAMGRNADQRWSRQVLQELDSPEEELRYEAAQAAGELMLEEAVYPLIELLDNEEVELRSTAIWSLGEIGGPEARRALSEAAMLDENETLLDAIDDALAMASLAEGVLGLLELPDDEEAM